MLLTAYIEIPTGIYCKGGHCEVAGDILTTAHVIDQVPPSEAKIDSMFSMFIKDNKSRLFCFLLFSYNILISINYVF